ncbi:MAG: RimK family alpha-L-glutamate ligase [Thiohalocapsa sp.]
MRIAIFTDQPGWHGARLRQAFAVRGAEAVCLSLRDCAIELQTGTARLHLPWFGEDLPDGVFVRGITGGTLEEVVFRLDVLHALEAMQILVYNSARAIERSVDKSLTSFLMAQANLPTPPTLITADPDEARVWVESETALGHALVCKPLFGSQGDGLVRIAGVDELPRVDTTNGVWYLQRFIETAETGASDWRLFVIGGQVVATMRRSNHAWLTNVAQGGQCHAGVAEGDSHRLAQGAAAILGMDYAGVDLMHDRDGRWWVIEINSIPAWRGLQGVCGADIAALLADDLLRRLQPHRSLEA